MTDAITSGISIEELIGDKRDDILRLAAEHKARQVRVFGSVARGEASPDNDLDLLVVFDADYTIWDQIGLKQDIEDLIHRRVDVVHEPFLREELKASVLEEATPL